MTETEPRVSAQAEPSEPAQPHDVFVSYSRADREVVVELVAGLDARGLKAWVDLEDIPPSAEWMGEIRAAIEASDGYLVVVSPSLASSEVCAEELELAHQAGKRIVPVMVRPTDPSSVPATLAALNWIDAIDGALEAASDRAVEALQTDLDHVRAHTKLGVRAAEWERKDDTKALLLRGAEITEAEAVVASGSEPRATPTQARYVQASRSAATKRQRGAIAAVAAALVASLALSAFALVQRGEAIEQREQALLQRDLARSGDLSSAALAELDDDPEVSLLLAMEAADVRSTERVEDALRESIKASNVLSIYREHPGKVADLDFGPDGSVASVGYENVIRIWDRSTGETSQVIRSPELVWGLSFDPRGRWVAAAVAGGVDLWDAETGRLSRRLRAPGTIYQAEFSADGSRIVGGGSDGTRIWDTRTGRVRANIASVPGGTYGADLSPDGRLVATGNGDGIVRIFDAASGRLLDTLVGHQDLGFFVRFSPGGKRLVSVAVDRTARVWDVRTGRQLAALSHAGLVQDADFLHEDFIVTSDTEGSARIWDIGSGEVVSELVGHEKHIAFLVVDQDRDEMATASDDGTVRIWRPGSGASILEVHRHGYPWAAEFVSADSFATAGSTNTIELWDSQTGSLDRRLRLDGPGQLRITDVAVSPDEAIIAVSIRHVELRGDATAGGSIVLQDLATGRSVSSWYRKGPVYPLSLDLDPSGRSAASTWTDGSTRVIDQNGNVIGSFEGGDGSSGGSVFSPDGSQLAFPAGREARIGDAATGELVGRLDGHDRPVTDIAFSPDGDHVATASSDGTARVWDLQSGRTTAVLRGHQGILRSIAYSPDGGYIVTTAADGTARTWTLGGVALQTFQVAESEVTSAVFSVDGHRILVTGLVGSKAVPASVGYRTGDEGFARIYACEVCVPLQELLALAASRVTRTLTTGERARFGLE